MAKAFKCDRCGDVVEGSRYATVSTNQSTITTGGYPTIAGKDGELCKGCTIKYIDWWNE